MKTETLSEETHSTGITLVLFHTVSLWLENVEFWYIADVPSFVNVTVNERSSSGI